MNKKGALVVIEGSDGTGKTVQSRKLIAHLRKEGYPTSYFDFPQYGKNIFADTVGAYLRGEFGTATDVDPYLASLIYAGDRWKVSRRLEKALRQGRIAVSNRYTSANMIHQGPKFINLSERGKFLSWLDQLEFSKAGYNIPRPSLTIILGLNPKVSQTLIDKKAQRDYTQGQKRDGHEASLKHLADAAQFSRELAETLPSWKFVDCTDYSTKGILSKNVIHELIWKFVEPILPS